MKNVKKVGATNKVIASKKVGTNVPKMSRKLSAVVKVDKVVIAKVIVPKKISSRLAKKLVSIDLFQLETSNSWDKLIHVANLSEVETFGLNRVLKMFLDKADGILTDSQMSHLTFKNVIDVIKTSEYSELRLFSFHQIKLICNSVIKKLDYNTKIAIKVAKQGGKIVANDSKLLKAIESIELVNIANVELIQA